MASEKRKAHNDNPLQDLPVSSLISEQILRQTFRSEADSASPEEQAQDCFYQALEASSPEEMLDLLEQALDLDPDNLDTNLFLNSLEEDSAVRIAKLREILASETARIGPKGFKEYAGHFWGFLATRPYMRARLELATELVDAGEIGDGITEYEGMLELNPDDNQGVRYLLLPCYLAEGKTTEARALLKRYSSSQNYSVVFSWGLLLLRLLSPRKTGLETALAAARKQNGYMEAYLKGHRSIPTKSPGAYELGSREEAACYAATMKQAWERHPDAVRWLQEQGKVSRKKA